MSEFVMLSVLLAGFGFGMLHALDADHLMTVASLSARTDSRRATVRFAALWALGHGGLLVAIAAAVLLLGWTLPASVPAGAERTVGVILIAAGASALWLRHPPHASPRSLREKAPFAFGLVHGLAGSAAMLALVPATLYHPALGLAYAVVFSVGVLAGMMGFGAVFGQIQQRLGQALPAAHRLSRIALGMTAIGMGAHWLAVA